MTQKYRIIKYLGNGIQGSLYLAIDKDNNRIICKKINMSTNTSTNTSTNNNNNNNNNDITGNMTHTGNIKLTGNMSNTGTQLLEPIMKVEVVTPEDYMGDVIGDLNSRRGQVSGVENVFGLEVGVGLGALQITQVNAQTKIF